MTAAAVYLCSTFAFVVVIVVVAGAIEGENWY